MPWLPSSSWPCTTEAAHCYFRIGHTAPKHSYIIDRQPRPICSFCRVALSVFHRPMEHPGLVANRTTCRLSNNLPDILTPDAHPEASSYEIPKAHLTHSQSLRRVSGPCCNLWNAKLGQ